MISVCVLLTLQGKGWLLLAVIDELVLCAPTIIRLVVFFIAFLVEYDRARSTSKVWCATLSIFWSKQAEHGASVSV